MMAFDDDNVAERNTAEQERARLDVLVHSIQAALREAQFAGLNEMKYQLNRKDLELKDKLLIFFNNSEWPITFRDGAFYVPVPPVQRDE